LREEVWMEEACREEGGKEEGGKEGDGRGCDVLLRESWWMTLVLKALRRMVPLLVKV